MSALKVTAAEDRLRRCVFVLPGATNPFWDMHDVGVEAGTILVTRSVSEALEFGADQWCIVTSGPWASSKDEEFEGARIRDLSRALSAAADASVAPVVIDESHAASLGTGILELFEAKLERRADVRALPGVLAVYAEGRPVLGKSTLLPLSLFNYGSVVTESAPDKVSLDLTGRSRPLVGGPYLSLSKGTWGIKLTFAVSGVLPGLTLRFEWGPMSGGVSEDLAITAEGLYELELDAAWEAASLCELRIGLPKGIFGGLFILQACSLRRCS